MVLLLPAVILNQWINDFSTHQASPARHPNLATRGHVHKVIHNHGSLASWALHRSNLLQQVVSISIGEDILVLKSPTRESPAIFPEKCIKKSHQHQTRSSTYITIPSFGLVRLSTRIFLMKQKRLCQTRHSRASRNSPSSQFGHCMADMTEIRLKIFSDGFPHTKGGTGRGLDDNGYP